MNTKEASNRLWSNSLSNFIYIGTRMVFGVLIFRTLYQALPAEEFGFWSLLWSVFSYSILLDFGIGFTTMKRVAELSARNNLAELSRVISTVFYFYVFAGLVACSIVFVSAEHIVEIFQISPANRPLFRDVLVVFLCGMAAGFPLAIFPEILTGLQRASIVNSLLSIFFILNYVLILVALRMQLGILWYTIIGLSCGFLPAIVSSFLLRRYIPGLRIKLAFFSWNVIRQNLRFSFLAYINTLTGIVLYRKDQLILSAGLTVAAVAVYQAAAKIAEIYISFAQQLPDAFSPAAAHLNACEDKAALRKLLVEGCRITILISTVGYSISSFYLDGLLAMITGDKIQSPETYRVGQVLLIWAWITVVTQGVPRRIFMMSGHEMRLTWLTTGEALLSIALSIGFLFAFQTVVSVTLGSLVAALVFGGIFLWPWCAREANMSIFEFSRKMLIPALSATLPLLIFFSIVRLSAWPDPRDSFITLLIHCLLASGIGLGGIWWLGLSSEERQFVAGKVANFYSKFAPGGTK